MTRHASLPSMKGFHMSPFIDCLLKLFALCLLISSEGNDFPESRIDWNHYQMPGGARVLLRRFSLIRLHPPAKNQLSGFLLSISRAKLIQANSWLKFNYLLRGCTGCVLNKKWAALSNFRGSNLFCVRTKVARWGEISQSFAKNDNFVSSTTSLVRRKISRLDLLKNVIVFWRPKI